MSDPDLCSYYDFYEDCTYRTDAEDFKERPDQYSFIKIEGSKLYFKHFAKDGWTDWEESVDDEKEEREKLKQLIINEYKKMHEKIEHTLLGVKS